MEALYTLNFPPVVSRKKIADLLSPPGLQVNPTPWSFRPTLQSHSKVFGAGTVGQRPLFFRVHAVLAERALLFPGFFLG